MWLRPGAPLVRADGEDPAYYLVTRSSERPAQWGAVLGIIGQARPLGLSFLPVLKPCRGVARWRAWGPVEGGDPSAWEAGAPPGPGA
ncbi:hypothetical protein [Nonomuraea dietziae]|uniref:hypothetical protein n=1 Tax=Nonomuraea dietziae TaxID=65515 RepID=UPI0034436815